MNTLLDGNRVRDAILAECMPRIQALKEKYGRGPGLAVILAGNDPASEVYVGSKTRTSLEIGMAGETIRVSPDTTTEELVQLVETLNQRADVDGILVQLPLPPQVDAQRVLLTVSPKKDVDGFHPCNVGNLATGRPGPRPCTPAGILELLHRYQIPIAGKHAVVIGRSDIVGKPTALLLLQENATVTICHSRTKHLAAICREAEILVAAIGRPAMVTKEFIRPEAVVVDVGVNRLDSADEVIRIFGQDSAKWKAFEKKGSVLVGDVHPVDAAAMAEAWTPVPGGVGPLTIAMLMRNTLESAERRMEGL